MANLYLCLAKGFGGSSKLHVLKRLRDNLRQEPTLVAMFLDEGRLATRLNHPNVVQTFDVGCDGDAPFIAMEYLEGQSLSKLLRKHQNDRGVPLPRGIHLRILCEAMRGLDYAHELRDFDGRPLNLVHRDVSPQNVFLTYSGAVKLIDFGIAKATMTSNTTEAGTMKGKASYVAPEQALGAPIDRRVDVFAMGMLLWAAAVGRPMWQTEPDVQRLTGILTGKLKMPREVDAAIPAELDAIVTRALQRQPEDRYRSIAELRDAVERYLATHEPAGTSNERELILAELFADKRRETEETIRRHVGRITAGDRPFSIQLRPEDFESPRSSRFPSHGPLHSERPTVTTTTPLVVPRRSRRLEMLLLGAALFLVSGVSFYRIVTTTQAETVTPDITGGARSGTSAISSLPAIPTSQPLPAPIASAVSLATLGSSSLASASIPPPATSSVQMGRGTSGLRRAATSSSRAASAEPEPDALKSPATKPLPAASTIWPD